MMRDEPDPAHRRLLFRLLRLTVPTEWADDIVRDMEEAHRALHGRGSLRADLWLSGQVLIFGCRFALERSRETLTASAMSVRADALRQDVRHTLRSFRRTPVFFGAIVLTLAIGIGPNTAMFSIVSSILVSPLPYPDPDRLVALSPNPWVPNGIILGIEEAGAALDDLAAFYPQQFAVTGAGGDAVEVEGAKVTHDFLDLFGARLAIGRDFTPADARPAAPRTAVISHGAWVRRHGQSPEVIGRVIDVNGEPHEIIGVTERGFRPLAPRTEDPELWIPFEVLLSTPDDSPPWAIPLARLSATVPMDRSQAELIDAIGRYEARGLEPEEASRSSYRWVTLKSLLTGDLRPALLVLQLSVGILLLLASVNVANLLLVRSSSRQGEVALRTALGASRGRLFRQLLTESLVLSGLGAVGGLVLMALSVDVILALAPEEVRRLSDVTLDSRALLFTLSVSVATGLLFAIAPAVASTGRTPHQLLKEGGRTTTGSKRRHGVSQGLVIAEVMLTLILVVGAGLLVRTFFSLSGQEPGFRTEGVVAVSLRVPQSRYRTVAELDGFYSRVLERSRRIPGVEEMGLSNNLPISRGGSTRAYRLERESGTRLAHYAVVSPGYFGALDIPLVRGRYVSDEDDRGAVPAAVIDEAMWREAWPGLDPIGRRFQLDNGTDTWLSVVGVVGDIRGDGLASGPGPGFYISHLQRPDTPVELAVAHSVVFLTSSATPVETLSAGLRQGIGEVDPTQPVPEIMTLDRILSERVTPQRFRALLLAAFASIALLLAIAGMHGVIGQLLAERMHELGVRQALGATKADMVRSVFQWGAKLTAAGLVLGVAGALAMSRILTGMLFGVTPTDPRTLAASVAIVLVIALSACIGPALRAARIDAVTALRSE